MIDYILDLWVSVNEMGLKHNVNPILFAVLYVGSIPPYMGSMVWAVKNYRKGRSIVFPLISTLLFFILPAMYIAIFGTDVAWWIYALIAFLLIYGSYSGVKKMQKMMKEKES